MQARYKTNLLDLLLILTILFSLTGFLFVKAQKTPLNKIIQGKEKISIVVLLPGVHSENNELFKTGDKAGITIRNRPYNQLEIINIEAKPILTVISLQTGSFKTIPDPTKTNVTDYIVTLKDTALKTKDGYVVGGNKVKIGNQIELEGFNYRLTGKIINIDSLNEQSR